MLEAKALHLIDTDGSDGLPNIHPIQFKAGSPGTLDNKFKVS